MQTALLPRITVRHLALSCQCINLLVSLAPLLRSGLLLLTQGPRRQLLLPDFDRMQQVRGGGGCMQQVRGRGEAGAGEGEGRRVCMCGGVQPSRF